MFHISTTSPISHKRRRLSTVPYRRPHATPRPLSYRRQPVDIWTYHLYCYHGSTGGQVLYRPESDSDSRPDDVTLHQARHAATRHVAVTHCSTSRPRVSGVSPVIVDVRTHVASHRSITLGRTHTGWTHSRPGRPAIQTTFMHGMMTDRHWSVVS